jgi:uncharacterized HNH endonuclease L247
MSYYVPLRAGIIRGDSSRYLYSTIPHDYTRGIEIISYPGVKSDQYAVTTEGKIINILTGLELKQYLGSKGYLSLSLPSIGGIMKTMMVHRIVAYQFCNPPTDIENYHVNHIDGNKQNNCCGNLEWLSASANVQHAISYLHSDRIISYSGKIRPDSTPEFIENICTLFADGKSDTEVMVILGMDICDPNYSFLRDIRQGKSWSCISSKYKFPRNSQNRVYTKHDKEKIKEFYRRGMDPYDIYYHIEGVKYDSSNEAMRKINAIKRVYGSMYKEFPVLNSVKNEEI